MGDTWEDRVYRTLRKDGLFYGVVNALSFPTFLVILLFRRYVLHLEDEEPLDPNHIG